MYHCKILFISLYLPLAACRVAQTIGSVDYCWCFANSCHCHWFSNTFQRYFLCL